LLGDGRDQHCVASQAVWQLEIVGDAAGNVIGEGEFDVQTAQVSTQDFFNFIQRDASLLAGIPRLARVAASGGGFPIKVDGEIVGAIGVSGAPMVQNDVDCATAALALLPDAVPTEQ
jgi:hypothetical protein